MLPIFSLISFSSSFLLSFSLTHINFFFLFSSFIPSFLSSFFSPTLHIFLLSSLFYSDFLVLVDHISKLFSHSHHSFFFYFRLFLLFYFVSVPLIFLSRPVILSLSFSLLSILRPLFLIPPLHSVSRYVSI